MDLIKITNNIYNIQFQPALNFKTFCKLLKKPAFALELSALLKKMPGPFYFEAAPVKLINDPVNIYLVNAKFASSTSNITGFANQITTKNKTNLIITFSSSTGSSQLIIPNPLINPALSKKYVSIYHFIKYSSDAEKIDFWSTVASQATKFLKTHGIVYLKTHGHGVDYFHFRLQKTAQYYIIKDL